jgi:hypothetical protein
MHCQEYDSPYAIEDVLDPAKKDEIAAYRKQTSDDCPGCQYACYFRTEDSVWSNLRELHRAFFSINPDMTIFDELFLQRLEAEEEKVSQ